VIDRGSVGLARQGLTYDAQRGLAAVTEALEHRVAHETDQHIVVSIRTMGLFREGCLGIGDLDDGIARD